jgi:hypothetical protein
MIRIAITTAAYDAICSTPEDAPLWPDHHPRAVNDRNGRPRQSEGPPGECQSDLMMRLSRSARGRL